MVHKIQDMPAGAVGLRVKSALTGDDYRNVIEPTLRDAVASGEVRLLLVAGRESRSRFAALLLCAEARRWRRVFPTGAT